YPADDAVLEIELAGYESGTDHDHLTVAGGANLDGISLRVIVADDFEIKAGDEFTIVTAEAIEGSFAALVLPSNIGGSIVTTDSTVVFVVDSIVGTENASDEQQTTVFALHPPYPNPASTQATIGFSLAEA